MKDAIELFSSTPSLLKIGGGKIKKIYVGNKEVTTMYIGNTLVCGLDIGEGEGGGGGTDVPIKSTPITDGLTCWLDARSLSDFTSGETWVDLSGNGNNGSITQVSLVSLENGILDGSGYINIPNPTKGLSNYTVEVGLKDLSMGYWLGLWGNTAGSTGNSVYKQNGAYSGYPISMLVSVSKTEREYYTMVVKDNRADIYINGLLLRENCCTLTPSDAKYFVFMGRKPNSATQDTDGVADVKRAEWYFLRIYDRALTGDEISFNYTYETSINRGMPNVEEVKPIDRS